MFVKNLIFIIAQELWLDVDRLILNSHIRSDALQLVVQPIVDILTRSSCSFRILVKRWIESNNVTRNQSTLSSAEKHNVLNTPQYLTTEHIDNNLSSSDLHRRCLPRQWVILAFIYPFIQCAEKLSAAGPLLLPIAEIFITLWLAPMSCIYFWTQQQNRKSYLRYIFQIKCIIIGVCTFSTTFMTLIIMNKQKQCLTV